MPEHAMKANTEQLSTLLLVDDDPLIAESLEFILSQHFHVVTADSRAAAGAMIAESCQTNIALVDLGLPPFPHKPDEGFELIRELIARNPHIKILVLSGQDEDVNIQHALTLGAVDFIAKPADPDLLLSRLQHHQRLLEIEVRREVQTDTGIVGDSLPIQAIKNQIQQFAVSPFPVLIEGDIDECNGETPLICKSKNVAISMFMEYFLVYVI